MYDVLIVGAGYAGSIMARLFAEQGKNVLVMEKRDHIAGNMYDYLDENGILVHKYGPHIAYINNWKTYNFLKQYSEFVVYHHHVNALIDGVEVPLPFNLTAIDRLFDIESASKLKKLMIDTFGMGTKVPILKMLQAKNEEIVELAKYIYEKVFLHYTMKMWDLTPETIDPSVTERVPVHVSYDNRHFTQEIQVMPKHGYTELFKNLISHDNIKVELGVDAKKRIKLEDGKIYFNGEIFEGDVVYTGMIDELFDFKYGELPYRSLKIIHETHPVDRIQEKTTLNWPDARKETRRTENKLLVCQPNVYGVTSTITEIPGAFDPNSSDFNVPYYPIPNVDNNTAYNKYEKESKMYKNLIMIGRLAQYRYYNMEAIILATLDAFEKYNKK